MNFEKYLTETLSQKKQLNEYTSRDSLEQEFFELFDRERRISEENFNLPGIQRIFKANGLEREDIALESGDEAVKKVEKNDMPAFVGIAPQIKFDGFTLNVTDYWNKSERGKGFARMLLKDGETGDELVFIVDNNYGRKHIITSLGRETKYTTEEINEDAVENMIGMVTIVGALYAAGPIQDALKFKGRAIKDKIVSSFEDMIENQKFSELARKLKIVLDYDSDNVKDSEIKDLVKKMALEPDKREKGELFIDITNKLVDSFEVKGSDIDLLSRVAREVLEK